MIDPERLLSRFLRYVQIDTTARDDAETYPSSPGQLELGRVLVEELRAIGLADAAQDQHGIVTATIASTVDRPCPVIGFCSHVDTSPETTGAGVKPQVVRAYDGRDLVLPGDTTKVIKVAENPQLRDVIGGTLITSDGTTLLGADDKAGVAVIIEFAAHLQEQPQLPHGPIRLLFTCDEEIGHGVDHVDIGKLNVVACYTLDGQGADEIDVETFSADMAIVTIRGVNIHPSIAKGRMVNAVRVSADFIGNLPRDGLSPETTEGSDGFLHPFAVSGGVAEVTLRVLLRDFKTEKLREQERLLRMVAAQCEARFPGSSIEMRIIQQYRNMAEGLARLPKAVGYAKLALERLGRTPNLTVVRGGTDGSRLTEKGLPTPNLSTGQHNPHSPLEWACLEEMVQAVGGIVELSRLWATP